MSRALRWTLLTLAFLALLAVVLFTVALWAIDRTVRSGRMETLIARATSDFLQRPLTIGHIDPPGFPFSTLVAHDVKLSEPSGALIVDCPEVRASASFTALFLLRLGVNELAFVQPRITVRFGKDGRTNLERIATEIIERPDAPMNRRVGALVFHRFTIRSGTVTVTGADGKEIAPVQAGVNGSIVMKISPLGVRAPFELDLDSGENAFRAHVTGAAGAAPAVSLVAERLPAALLAPRWTGLAPCAGTTDGRFDWAGGPGVSKFSFAVDPARLCGEGFPDRLSGDVRQNKGHWTVALDVAGQKTDGKISGDLPAGAGPAVWTVDAKHADAEEAAGWIRQTQVFLGGVEPSTPTVAHLLSFDVRVATLTATRLILNDVAADLKKSSDGVTRIDPITATVYGGSAKGDAVLSSATLAVNVAAENVNLSDAVRAFGSTSPLSGLLDAHLSARGPVTNFLYTMDGTLSIGLTDALIPRVPAILKTLTSANLVKLEDEMKGEGGRGLSIRQASAEAHISSGIATVSKSVIDSRVLRIGFTGDVSYISQKFDGLLVLQPLNIADQIVNDIPVLRSLLLGKDKTFLPLWFEIKGPWKDPKVKSMPVRSLTTPVRNVLNGILSLPLRAADVLRGKED